ncbi:hypothetical protein [Moritella sp. 28]|uniref:hypothetical protein n=1 Tax=Moritella sp. 28 TaxID=2746232 RepID=UPI001BA80E80|nr:hypothetical protein [Moritella sp. 28]QUM86027.1 hypothetical protein HWV02_16670 [Moritella sp. 28]
MKKIMLSSLVIACSFNAAATEMKTCDNGVKIPAMLVGTWDSVKNDKRIDINSDCTVKESFYLSATELLMYYGTTVSTLRMGRYKLSPSEQDIESYTDIDGFGLGVISDTLDISNSFTGEKVTTLFYPAGNGNITSQPITFDSSGKAIQIEYNYVDDNNKKHQMIETFNRVIR